jgi:hypothetical protein
MTLSDALDTARLYDIARMCRDRAWDDQAHINPSFPGWEPRDLEAPTGDVERWWFHQGKAEAFAAVMSEIESSQ